MTLSLRVPYHAFEPAYALFGRLALRHGYSDIGEFGLQVGLRFRDLATARAVAVVAEMAGVDLDILQSWSPIPSNKGFRFRDSNYCHHTWNLRANRRICVGCLQEDYEKGQLSEVSCFRRFWWDCQEIDTCSIHGTVLLSTCPACKNPLNARGAHICRCLCGYDFLTHTSGIKAPLASVEADKYILDRILGVNGNTIPPLDELSPEDAIFALRRIGIFSLNGSEEAKINRRAIDTRLNIKAQAFSAVLEWPKRFFALLDCSHTAGKAGQRRTQAGPYREYGVLYHWLNSKPSNEFVSLKAAVETHFRQNVPCHASVTIFGGSARNGKFVSLSVANKHCGLPINSKFLLNFLPELNRGVADAHKSSCSRVLRESLNRLAEMCQDAISLKETSRILGVSQITTARLIKAKLLDAIYSPNGSLSCILAGSASALVTELSKGSVSMDRVPTGYTDITSCNLGVVAAIVSIRKGELAVSMRNINAHGLKSILVSRDAVRSLKQRNVPTAGMVLKVAAQRLRVSERMMSDLVRNGIISTVSCDQSNRKRILEADLEKFCASYVALSEVCTSKMSPRGLLRTLGEYGINPDLNRPKFNKVFFTRSKKLIRILGSLGIQLSPHTRLN